MPTRISPRLLAVVLFLSAVVACGTESSTDQSKAIPTSVTSSAADGGPALESSRASESRADAGTDAATAALDGCFDDDLRVETPLRRCERAGDMPGGSPIDPALTCVTVWLGGCSNRVVGVNGGSVEKVKACNAAGELSQKGSGCAAVGVPPIADDGTHAASASLPDAENVQVVCVVSDPQSLEGVCQTTFR